MIKDLLVNGLVKPLSNRHREGDEPNVFLMATPRGGSTWLMEMIWSQPEFKSCNEPLDLRNPLVRRHLGAEEWEELYAKDAQRLLEPYFERLSGGRLYIVDPLPFRGKYHRRRTSRTVFKLLHGAEDRVPWLVERFNGKAVLLMRHPIPVSLSRKHLPRLTAFVESDYRRHFEAEQLRLARRIIDAGTPLERGVLDWCFQTSLPLRHRDEEWLVVCYEQMVMEPDVVIGRLADELDLPDPERMRAHVTEASAVTSQSDEEAKRLLGQGDRQADRSRLIERWRGKVEAHEEERAMEILSCFGIDAYLAGEALPNRKYWLEAKQAPAGAAAGQPKRAEATRQAVS